MLLLPKNSKIMFQGQMIGFPSVSSGHIVSTHPGGGRELYSLKIDGTSFVTDKIDLKYGGITTIKITIVNALGQKVSTEGYARYGIPGYSGFTNTIIEKFE